MEEKYYLINWTMNWADEMDVIAYEVMTEEEHNKALELIDKYDPKTLIYFGLGTNEGNEEILSTVRTWVEGRELTKTEYDSFISMFGGKTIGGTSFEDLKLDLEHQ